MKSVNYFAFFLLGLLVVLGIAAVRDEAGQTIRFRQGTVLSFDSQVTLQDEGPGGSWKVNAQDLVSLGYWRTNSGAANVINTVPILILSPDGNPSIDASGRSLYTHNSSLAVVWDSRQMFGASGSFSIDWGSRNLYASNSSTNLSWGTAGIVKAAGALQIGATTNQLIWGATNVAPSSIVSPTKWVSVQVNGEPTAYRIPLYQ